MVININKNRLKELKESFPEIQVNDNEAYLRISRKNVEGIEQIEKLGFKLIFPTEVISEEEAEIDRGKNKDALDIALIIDMQEQKDISLLEKIITHYYHEETVSKKDYREGKYYIPNVDTDELTNILMLLGFEVSTDKEWVVVTQLIKQPVVKKSPKKDPQEDEELDFNYIPKRIRRNGLYNRRNIEMER